MKKTILKFKDVDTQPAKMSADAPQCVRRAVGFVELKNLLPLFDNASLASNPRRAKKNRVVTDILNTLNNTPELFHYKSKGILISSSDVEPLDRGRFRIGFAHSTTDGILDGGHNMFAIGHFVLSGILSGRDLSKIRDWDELKAAWDEHADDIKSLQDDLDEIYVAVELLFPADPTSETKTAFELALFEISQARNNNAQVTDEAFQNHLGFYEPIKHALPEDLSRRVEWKPGEVEDESGAVISPKDIVALAWIPLNALNSRGLLPEDISVSPQNIYRNKGECSEKFGRLMRREDVTTPAGGKDGQTRRLIHKGIESALDTLGKIPGLVDMIYEEFPSAYNSGGYNFGRRKQVKMYKPEELKALKAAGKDHSGYTATRPTTPFFGRSSKKMVHKYPEAFIVPFVTSLSAFMEISNGKIRWKTSDVEAAVYEKLKKAAPLFDSMLEAHNWDPQALAKNQAVHRFAAQLMSM